jgi:hypothetical protein
MRKAILALAMCGGCISGGAVVVHDNPDPDASSGSRVMRQAMRQDLWAQQALNSRPTPQQLETLRSGRDQASTQRARKELTNLMQAVDRATWIRDTTSELMREDGDPRLAQEFDRAGRLRADALRAAGETADALIDGGAGLTQADLRLGYDAVRKAQASEDRLARLPVGPTYPRLAPSPLPVPNPLDRASAKLNGGGAPPQAAAALPPIPITNDTVKAHAGAADLERQKEQDQRDADLGPPTEAAAPQTTLTIANDALDIITRKRPRSITLREDGLFALSCADGEYLVGPDGKLVRKEAPSP